MTAPSAFKHIVGTVLNSNTRYQGYGAGIPATLHHEIWLSDEHGREHFLHLIDDEFPVRKSQRLEAIYVEGQLAGLINYTSNRYINLLPYAYPVACPDVFPDLLNLGHMALVVGGLMLIGLVFQRHAILAFPAFLLLIGFVLFRNRKRPEPPPLPNPLHDRVEAEIRKTLAARTI